MSDSLQPEVDFLHSWYILGQCFCPNLPANCFYKGEETSQYKFGSVKGKGVISG